MSFTDWEKTSALSFGYSAVEELHTTLNSSWGKDGRCLLELTTELDIKYNKNQHKGPSEAVSVRALYTWERESYVVVFNWLRSVASALTSDWLECFKSSFMLCFVEVNLQQQMWSELLLQRTCWRRVLSVSSLDVCGTSCSSRALFCIMSTTLSRHLEVVFHSLEVERLHSSIFWIL